MAVKKFAHHFDLNKLFELRNWLHHLVAGDPSSPANGQDWVDTNANRYKIRLNGVTKTLAHLDEVSAGMTFDTPGSSAVGDTVAAGSDTDAARADHRHGREAFGAVTALSAFGVSSANGSASTDARSDHVHGSPAHDAAAHSAIKLSDLAVPTADVSLNSHKLTAVTNGTADSDAANYGQLQAAIAGLLNKTTVRVASTANVVIASALENGDTIDGVVLATGDRVLLAYQTTGSENGIYLVPASGAAARATDADISAEVKAGLYVFVSEGTANGNKGFQLFTNDPITLGSTSLDFQIVSAAGQITATAPIVKTGDTLSFVGASAFGTGGPGGGLTNAGAVDSGVVSRWKEFTIGDGAASTFALTHSFGSKTVHVTVRDTTDDTEWDVGVTFTSTTVVTLDFGAVVPTTNQFVVLVSH